MKLSNIVCQSREVVKGDVYDVRTLSASGMKYVVKYVAYCLLEESESSYWGLAACLNFELQQM